MRNKLTIVLSFIMLILGNYALTAQSTDASWYHLNLTDNTYGIGTDEAYELVKNKKGSKVVVAVIDSGVDEDHEDLALNMWVNEDEISGNNIDDDNNGYVDDIHGWNFIGGPDGENVKHDNLEITRLLRKYERKYGDIENPTKLHGEERTEYAYYLTLQRDVKRERQKAQTQLEQMERNRDLLMSKLEDLEDEVGNRELTEELLNSDEFSEDPDLITAVNVVKNIMAQSGEDFENIDEIKEWLEKQFQRQAEHFIGRAHYMYNVDFDPRDIVGDDYNDPYQSDYGNNDYTGPDAFHGTHVAGIIAAQRHNDIGIDGVADNAKIMVIRAVPDGDERDKDVANAIRYAVDNGASIINLSFGKGYSWDKEVVDEAVKYAAKHDVLIVHAAGNSAQDNDANDNFPNPCFERSGLFKPKHAKNWIEVGALSKDRNENAIASFSNYGRKSVDVFAPGTFIYSTIPDNEYSIAQGTSMAAPMVAGVAAMIRSYYPTLTAEQVKKAIVESAPKFNLTVRKPGTDDMVKFETLSASGGVLHAEEAMKMASTMKGKKKRA